MSALPERVLDSVHVEFLSSPNEFDVSFKRRDPSVLIRFINRGKREDGILVLEPGTAHGKRVCALQAWLNLTVGSQAELALEHGVRACTVVIAYLPINLEGVGSHKSTGTGAQRHLS